MSTAALQKVEQLVSLSRGYEPLFFKSTEMSSVSYCSRRVSVKRPLNLHYTSKSNRNKLFHLSSLFGFSLRAPASTAVKSVKMLRGVKK